MPVKRIELRIKNGLATLTAYGHMARGAERVLGQVVVKAEDLDAELKKKEVQEWLHMVLPRQDEL